MPRSPAVRALAMVASAAILGGLTSTLESAAASVSGRYESDVTRYSNAERTKRQLPTVASTPCLQAFAERQASAMAGDRRIYHQVLSPILTDCDLREVGENVAFGYPDGASATRAWMVSPAHEKNLLNPAHQEIGVGAARDSVGRWYVSQVFGRSAGLTPTDTPPS